MSSDVLPTPKLSMALELDLLQVWGDVDLVRHTDLMPADRLRNSQKSFHSTSLRPNAVSSCTGLQGNSDSEPWPCIRLQAWQPTSASLFLYSQPATF